MTRPPTPPVPPPTTRRRLRETAALTQAQLAARVGVTRDTVRAWESGRTTPRGRRAEAYVRLLHTLAEEREREKARERENEREGEREREREKGPGAERAEAGPEAASEEAPVPEPEPASGCEGVPVSVPVVLAVGAVTAGGGRNGPSGGADGRADGSGGGAPGAVVGRVGADPVPGLVPDPVPGLVPDAAPDALPHPVPDGDEAPAMTPAQAFDLLYGFAAPALVRQTYLLTGRRELARESVERAFQLAWERWPEVARDRDPAGWVRAAAYEYALSPWNRWRRRHRSPEPPPPDTADRALLDTLLRLPPSYRRTLLLHDGVGVGLSETAAETEASTPATAHRLMNAREAVADRLPGLAEPGTLHRRLAELASTARLRAAEPPAVRRGSERRARFMARAAIAFTAALIGTTTLALRTAPTHYEPPVSPGETVRGVPPKVAPGPLSDDELALRQKLRDEAQAGPERLVPRPG
ncbi:helix-turn-helix domain-containing protein [Streptomyces tagetis]|uniref:Helix-turn-helix domain-containing protein n=1 Tax=Streptomyces tagetis TaxID=2820809 RepID=A0A941AZC1_9ACTN|nr:helix-turn-helix domain-containing protein [Streptomyces sp. RG38]MBQ0828594.1 helix-turn-helix domain-containing protein [Streptomyces sp. RG38]